MKRFNVEKVRRGFIEYGRIGQNQLDWLAEDIECPKCKGSGKALEHYHYDVEHQSSFNETGIWECELHHLCNGTGKIQRLMHPDYWDEVK